jgi:hypothetical protein
MLGLVDSRLCHALAAVAIDRESSAVVAGGSYDYEPANFGEDTLFVLIEHNARLPACDE